jgi:hypothetical protein
LLEEKLHSLKLLFCPSICCLDSLGSNDNAPSDALVYDKNHTSFQSKCCLVLHHLEIWNYPAPTRSHLHIHNISPANEVPQNWSTACFLITSNNLQTMPTFPSKLMKSALRHIKPREGYGKQPMTTVGLCFARKLQPNRKSRHYNVLQLR